MKVSGPNWIRQECLLNRFCAEISDTFQLAHAGNQRMVWRKTVLYNYIRPPQDECLTFNFLPFLLVPTRQHRHHIRKPPVIVVSMAGAR